MCYCNVWLDGTIHHLVAEDSNSPKFAISVGIRDLPPPGHVGLLTQIVTVDYIRLRHQHTSSLSISIDTNSLQSLQILAAIVASLPAITSVAIKIYRADLPDIVFDVPFAARALWYASDCDSSGYNIIRQFARYATHVRILTASLADHPIPVWLPSVTTLFIDVCVHAVSFHATCIQPFIDQLPLLEGLFIIQPYNHSQFHLSISHPNIRYLNPITNLLPDSRLPRLSPTRVTHTPCHFHPYTSYLETPMPVPSGPALGCLLSSFLLAVHRLFPDTDPLVITSIFTHLTNKDGVIGPEYLASITHL